MTLAIVIAYAAGLVALGLFLSRRFQSTKDFFVAGRTLPPRPDFRDVSGRQHRRGIDRRRDGRGIPPRTLRILVDGISRARITGTGLLRWTAPVSHRADA